MLGQLQDMKGIDTVAKARSRDEGGGSPEQACDSRKGTHGVSTNGFTVNFMFFDRVFFG